MVVTHSDAFGGRDARDRNGGGAVSGAPIPEMALVVVAPTLHLAVRQQDTRVLVAQSDACGGRDARDLNGGGS